METVKGPLIVIVGQTASGKTALAIEIAKKINGEIICADSKTIYRNMDIGTAKPTKKEQNGIRHYLLDIADPDEKFTVADFKYYVEEAIEEIQSKEKIPILVGGSGLFIDSIIYNYDFGPVNEEIRSRYQGYTVNELQDELKARNIDLPENKLNHRYLLRALETGGLKKSSKQMRENTLIIGLELSKDELKTRIEKRIDNTLEVGLIREIIRLSKKYDWDLNSMQTPAYKAFRPFVEEESTLEDCRLKNVELDMKLAKKQKTWFKRNNSIRWIDDPSKALEIVKTFLNKTS